MKRVLVATAVPYWRRQKGNQQRIFQLVDFLARHYSVTVFYMGHEDPPADRSNVSHIAFNPHGLLNDLAWRLLNGMSARMRTFVISILNRLSYSRTMQSFYSEKTLIEFKRLNLVKRYHAVIIEYAWYGYLADAIVPDRSIAILDVHDIIQRRAESYARFGRVPDKTATKDEEIAVYRKFDFLIAIQRAEFAYLQALFPGKVLMAMHPQAPEPASYRQRLAALESGARLNLLYFGSFGDLNLDAIDWFLENVWSEAMAEQFVLNIYGAVCDALSIGSTGVVAHGRVAEIGDAYRVADIAINPVRFGSGLKIKNVEALAFGVPLVTTSVGAEGLEEGIGEFLLCADDADRFRQALFDLRDTSARRLMSAKALAFAAGNLTPDACFRDLKNVIDESADDRA